MDVERLVEFLRARLDEDERAARYASPGGWQYGDVDSIAGGSLYDRTRMIASLHYEQPDDHDGSIVRHLLVPEADANGNHIVRHDPARVLAEVDAKRRIVDECERVLSEAEIQQVDQQLNGEAGGLHFAVQCLALPYAGHPDYRDEWRPV